MIFFHHTPVYHSFFRVSDLLKPHFSQDLYDLAAAICSERESEEADHAKWVKPMAPFLNRKIAGTWTIMDEQIDKFRPAKWFKCPKK
jgi:hypothetical protein